MGKWWEYDSGPAIKVPEPDHDDRPGMAFALWFVGIVALVVAVVGMFARTWGVAWLALAVVFGCSVMVAILLPRSKPTK